MRFQRIALITLSLLIGLIVVFSFLWVRRQQRQHILNRQLIAALDHDDARQALALVETGADPNARIDAPPQPSFDILVAQLMHRLPPPVPDSPTAFMFACGAGYERMSSSNPKHNAIIDDPRLLSAMIVHGADVNAHSRYGWSALEGAIFYDRPCVVALLLEHGATGDLLVPPLTMAVEDSPDLALIQVLLTHGARVNMQNSDGQTPLMLAVPLNPEIARLLLEFGAAVNMQDNSGDTALHYVLQNANDVEWLDVSVADSIRLLLAHGAQPNIPDKQGETALMLAQHRRRPNILALLKRAAAKQ